MVVDWIDAGNLQILEEVGASGSGVIAHPARNSSAAD